MKRRLLIISGIIFILISACKKDNNNNNNNNTTQDLLANAVEYTGMYPEPANVAYVDRGIPVEVRAYPGQVMVFFNVPANESDDSALIGSHAGTVIGKIPEVGYYFINVSDTAVESFINAMQSDSRVDFACPDITANTTGGANVLDGCGSGIMGNDHADRVMLNLESCGGVVDNCSNTWISTDGIVGMDNILHGVIKTINDKPNENIYINISASSGFNDGTWPNHGEIRKGRALVSWYLFMRKIIKIISSLDAQYREHLVVTISSGNGNMPITDMLNQLRVNPVYKDVLDKNVLIVSNKSDSTDDYTGNYSKNDPEVAVLKNPDAWLGTSYAAPCAMGIIQHIVDSEGVSTEDALQAVKLAVSLNDEHKLVESEAVQLIDLIASNTKYKGYVSTIVFGPYPTGPCFQTFNFVVSPVIYWNGTKGSMIMPTHYFREVVEGECIMTGVIQYDQTFQISLSGTNSNLSGGATKTFQSGGSEFPLTATFTGAVNIYGDITGTLKLSIMDEESKEAVITLIKQ